MNRTLRTEAPRGKRLLRPDQFVPLAQREGVSHGAQLLDGIDAGLEPRPEDRPQSARHWRIALGFAEAPPAPPVLPPQSLVTTAPAATVDAQAPVAADATPPNAEPLFQQPVAALGNVFEGREPVEADSPTAPDLSQPTDLEAKSLPSPVPRAAEVEKAQKKNEDPPILYQLIGVAFWAVVIWFGYQWWNTESSISSNQSEYENSCLKGEEKGCQLLANARDWTSTDPNNATFKSRLAFETACTVHNIGVACSEIAEWNLVGWGTSRNIRRALFLYRKACRAGHSDGCAKAAQIVQKGAN
ncbi:MAG: hypothetical protein ABL912_04345 [Novosphingobium sp.]